MINKIVNWFRKEEDEISLHLPSDEQEKFILKLDKLEIGYLECIDGIWKFYYSEEFKKSKEYNLITGFPKKDKVYENKSLWPFFQIRIPGLAQPAIKDILSSTLRL